MSSSILDQAGYAPYKAYYTTQVIPDYHICTGGTGSAATCFGDSGGPVVANADNPSARVVVGVTSFGLSGFCGMGPNYTSRLAMHASWIATQISTKSLCTSAASSSFSGSPTFAITYSSTFNSSRCTSASNPWQCQWGTCLASAQVCNKATDCVTPSGISPKDTSDEGLPFCSSVKGYPTSGFPTNNFSQKTAAGSADASTAELQDLIDQYLLKHPHVHDRASREYRGPGSVVVVGNLNVDRVHNVQPPGFDALVNARSRAVKKPATTTAATTSTTCSTINATINSLISAQVAAANNSAEQDPSQFQSACQTEKACEVTAGFTVSSSVSSFCTKMLTFIQQKAQAAQLATTFDSTYGEACHAR
jgi:hypothetical protein